MIRSASVYRWSLRITSLLASLLPIVVVACSEPETVAPSPTATPAQAAMDAGPTPAAADQGKTASPAPTVVPRVAVPITTPSPAPTAVPRASPEPLATGRAALVALYNATDGANWKNNDKWLSEAPIGEWYGVTTDSDGRVTELNLNNNQLSGEVPSELGNLTSLRRLNLTDNQLSGKVPPWLGDLTSLEWLGLPGNRFTGCIPAKLLEVPTMFVDLPFCAETAGTESARSVPTKTPVQGVKGEQQEQDSDARQSEQVVEVPPAGSDPAEFRRVIQDLDRAIEFDPDNALAYNRRGLAYSRLGEHERAIKDFDRAVKLDPTDALAHYNMGNAHATLGWFNAAIGNLDMAFELDPGLEWTMDPDADIARAYMIRVHDHIDLMGEYDRAVEDYERAVQFAPDDPSALNGLCWFMGLAGRAAEALPHCNRALSIDPDYFHAYDSRALALALLGDYEKAVEDFTRFLDWLNDQSRSDYEKYGPARERWIASLRRGENPFTEAEIQVLWKE